MKEGRWGGRREEVKGREGKAVREEECKKRRREVRPARLFAGMAA